MAEALSILSSTLSPHLARLDQAGLATSSRDEQRIYYAFNIDGMRRLLAFLNSRVLPGTSRACRGLQQATGFLIPAQRVG